MSGAFDHLILCLSQPSLSARQEAALLEMLRESARDIDCPVQAIRLEGNGLGLPDALRHARDMGAQAIRVQPVGLPMAANMLAWLPGAVAHWQEHEGAGVAVMLADPPAPEAILPQMVSAALAAEAKPDTRTTPSLGKPGWQYLPDHDTHVFVCTGPRCAFRGAGTLVARLKAKLAAAGLSGRCLTTSTGCIYPCNQGPVIALYPQNAWYRVPDEAALDRIVTDVIGAGQDAPDLRLQERPGSRRDALFTLPERTTENAT